MLQEEACEELIDAGHRPARLGWLLRGVLLPANRATVPETDVLVVPGIHEPVRGSSLDKCSPWNCCRTYVLRTCCQNQILYILRFYVSLPILFALKCFSCWRFLFLLIQCDCSFIVTVLFSDLPFHKTSADLKRPHGHALLRGPNSFIFMQFSAKNLQNNGLSHPLSELAPPLSKILDQPLQNLLESRVTVKHRTSERKSWLIISSQHSVSHSCHPPRSANHVLPFSCQHLRRRGVAMVTEVWRHHCLVDVSGIHEVAS